MNEELLLQTVKKVAELEKKLDTYYSLLKIQNELDFIMKGTYILQSEIDNVLIGNYSAGTAEIIV